MLNDFDHNITSYRFSGMVRVTRPLIVAQGVLYTVVGVYFSAPVNLLDLATIRTVCGLAVVALVIAFGCVLNDWRDADSDALSKPQRPIPSGQLTSAQALVEAGALGMSALVVAVTLGFVPAAIAAGTITVCIAYSLYLKNSILIGNVMQATLAATTLPFGGLICGHITRSTWLTCALTFMYMLSFEVLHTACDAEGDSKAGLHTIATRFGIQNTLRLFRILCLATIAFGLLLWFLKLAPDRYLFTIVPCSVIPTAAIVFLLSEQQTPYMLDLARRLMKVVWVLSLLPVILLK